MVGWSMAHGLWPMVVVVVPTPQCLSATTPSTTFISMALISWGQRENPTLFYLSSQGPLPPRSFSSHLMIGRSVDLDC